MNRNLVITLAAISAVLAGLNLCQFSDRQSLRNELALLATGCDRKKP